jgi:hypothetical protein
MVTGVRPADATTLAAEEEVERRRAQLEKNQDAIALLDSWANATEEEIQEQIETWEFLKRALDEDRLSYRKFFS